MKGKIRNYILYIVLLTLISCTANMMFRGPHGGATNKVGEVVVIEVGIDSTVFKDIEEVHLINIVN